MTKKYKVCFVGLGSIATRHIRNLKEMLESNIEIDVLRSGKGRASHEELKGVVSNVYYRKDELPKDYDILFITNPTRMHYETLIELHNHAKHFFIEKPVFETGTENICAIGLRDASVYYVACPLRYTNVIQYLRDNIDFSKVYSVRCISSSYLPEWRQGTDYRQTYSAKKELGGGVSIDLIHEWDYLCYLLGMPLEVKCYISRTSNLEINSDDIAIYIAKYEDKFVELHLDYFGRESIRKIELFTDADTIEADLLAHKVIYKKSGEFIDLNEDRDSFQKKELQHFFDIIEGNCQNDNSLDFAMKTLRITRGKDK